MTVFAKLPVVLFPPPPCSRPPSLPPSLTPCVCSDLAVAAVPPSLPSWRATLTSGRRGRRRRTALSSKARKAPGKGRRELACSVLPDKVAVCCVVLRRRGEASLTTVIILRLRKKEEDNRGRTRRRGSEAESSEKSGSWGVFK